MFKKFAVAVLVGSLALMLLAVVCLIAAIPTYFLWNWLMPEIFAIKVITFWQAWGVNCLTGILFKIQSSPKSKD